MAPSPALTPIADVKPALTATKATEARSHNATRRFQLGRRFVIVSRIVIGEAHREQDLLRLALGGHSGAGAGDFSLASQR